MNYLEIEAYLKDYHWMINSVKIGQEVAGTTGVSGGNLTAQYGIEAVMPKAQGGTSDPVYNEVVRRDKHITRMIGYKSKIRLIQEHIHVIHDARETEVLHWILEGKSYSWIARHMGLSHTHIKRLFSSIAKQIAGNVQHVQKVQDCS